MILVAIDTGLMAIARDFSCSARSSSTPGPWKSGSVVALRLGVKGSIFAMFWEQNWSDNAGDTFRLVELPEPTLMAPVSSESRDICGLAVIADVERWADSESVVTSPDPSVVSTAGQHPLAQPRADGSSMSAIPESASILVGSVALSRVAWSMSGHGYQMRSEKV